MSDRIGSARRRSRRSVPATRFAWSAARCWLAAVALVSATGCSGGSASTPEGTLQTFLRALGSADSATVCSVVAYDDRPLQGDDIALCRSGFDAVARDVATPSELAQLRQATVTDAVVTGDRAVVRADQITGVPAAYQVEVALVRVDGRWYVVTPR